MHVEQQERRRKAERIWWAGVHAVQPLQCIPAALDALRPAVQDWRRDRPYLVVGGGKAGAAMAQVTEQWLLAQGITGGQIGGWLNVPEGATPDRLECITLHPARPAGVNFPTPAAVAGTRRILEMVEQGAEETLILCLISGGGSALLTAPVEGVPLEDKVRVSRQLSAAGAGIEQLNTVRKHLSQIKGGGLAGRAFARGGRQLVSLIISDVIGDPLDVIASGPTAADPSTFADALAVLDRLGIRADAPASVVRYLEAGARGERPETLKSLPQSEPHLIHRIIANNRLALNAAAREARALGYDVLDLGDDLVGDTLKLATDFVRQVPEWEHRPPLCVLSGGETTVRLPPKPGKGGRNQSLALALLEGLNSATFERATFLCGGTDGEDGPTDAAGAFTDAEVLRLASAKGLDPSDALRRHDAYPFLAATTGLFRTGLTETNVMDLRVFLFD